MLGKELTEHEWQWIKKNYIDKGWFIVYATEWDKLGLWLYNCLYYSYQTIDIISIKWESAVKKEQSRKEN